MHKSAGGSAMAAAFVVAAVLPFSATAEVAGFYEGRPITVVNAGGAGGASAAYGQLVTPFVQKYMPGQPSIIVQYMPGAGGAKAANYLFSAAAQDGSMIGQPLQEMPLWARLGTASARYDPEKFHYLGGADVTRSTISVMKKHTEVRTIEDAKQTEVVMAAGGKASQPYMYPAIANAILGTKFKIVLGYPGTGQMNLAIERGEAHGRGGSWGSFKGAKPEWIRDDALAHLAVIGPDPEPDLPGVPLLSDLASTPEDRAMLELVSVTALVGRAWVAPPGVPAERVAALRDAFAKALRDPELVAEAKRRNLDLNPVGWEKQQDAVQKILSADQSAVDRLRDILGL
jgi:tripartite-type tricarboxylate transporter receptor subunit TctC